jgi:pilus assembly protein CpaE
MTMPLNLHKIQVLILRGELPGVTPIVVENDSVEALLRNDPRFKTTVASAGFGQSVATAEKHRPEVIVLEGVYGDPADLVAELDEAMSDIPMVVVLDEAQQDRTQACVVAGARGCLTRPFEPATLVATVLQVHERASRHRRVHAVRAGAVDAVGQLVAVRGAKGGVGASVVATNLAISIRRETQLPTALVDGHFFGGDIPLALNLKPTSSLIDLVRHVNGLDEEMLRGTLVEHSSGVAVLAAPTEFEDADTIRADDYQRVLDALRMRYSYVVVDCSPAVDQSTLTALDMADLLLLVSTPELAALKNAARVLELGARLGYTEDKMRLVMNRFNASGVLAPSDYQQYLAYNTSFRIPNDGSVVQSLTRGEPAVTRRGGKAGKALDRLARVVVAGAGWEGEPKPSRGRGLLRFVGRRQPTALEGLRLQPGVEAA